METQITPSNLTKAFKKFTKNSTTLTICLLDLQGNPPFPNTHLIQQIYDGYWLEDFYRSTYPDLEYFQYRENLEEYFIKQLTRVETVRHAISTDNLEVAIEGDLYCSQFWNPKSLSLFAQELELNITKRFLKANPEYEEELSTLKDRDFGIIKQFYVALEIEEELTRFWDSLKNIDPDKFKALNL